MRIIPRNSAFFDDFDRHTALIVAAAQTLSKMLGPDGGAPSDLARQIKGIEEEADRIVHRVVVQLRQTFITPLDRDDTHRLVSHLDDILDQIESVAYRLALYRLPVPNRHLTALVQLVERSAMVTRDAVANLREASTRDRALELCVEINKIENEADAALRGALAELFSDGIDPVSLIKWKEVFETLEDTTDRCEDVANAIENLLLDS
jgi:predicted phosphate transport protein (TIGR00153 family)